MKLLIWAILLSATPAMASDYQAPLEQFFKLYQAERKNRAVEQLYWFNRDRKDKSNDSKIAARQAKLKDASEALGLYYGHELLGTHQIGKRLIHVTYLLIHQEAPIRVEFEFYKPQEQWLLSDFQVDSALGSELKTLARQDIAGFLVERDVDELKN